MEKKTGDSFRKNRTSHGISAVAWSALQPEEESSTVSCRKTWACSSKCIGFCCLCHTAINPEQLHWNEGNYSRFMPVSVKRGFLLNGSGQLLARWKGKKWLSFRQLLLITGFCQAQSHRFLFFFPSSSPCPPFFFFSFGSPHHVSDCFAHCTEERT